MQQQLQLQVVLKTWNCWVVLQLHLVFLVGWKLEPWSLHYKGVPIGWAEVVGEGIGTAASAIGGLGAVAFVAGSSLLVAGCFVASG